jgi:SAM-dependent methyltransferase
MSTSAVLARQARDTPKDPGNRRTLRAYEGYALNYAAATAGERSPTGDSALKRVADMVGPGNEILEIGSGPGWDADFLEDSLGLKVDRTDATNAFLKFQADRGKAVRKLDLVSDGLGGPYAGVIALHVLQHIKRDLIDRVIANIFEALRPGGVFLATLREGSGELREGDSGSGSYQVVLWPLHAFEARLSAAGFRIIWTARSTDSDGDWMTILARRAS